MSNALFRTVYSTEKTLCRQCGKDPCLCAQRPAGSDRPHGPVRVGRETKGRKGAGVTVVTGLGLDETQLRELLTVCKKRLGCGGTLRGSVLEFQGEHRDALLTILAGQGINAKRSGG